MGRRGRKPSGTKGKRARVPYPQLQPAYRRWKVDYDYLGQLDEAATRYLSQFTDEYYAADFRYDEPFHRTEALRRDAYARQNENARDAYSLRQAVGALDVFDETTVGAEAPRVHRTTEYQETEEYRAARAEYRVLVDVRIPSPKQLARLELLQAYLLSIAESENPGEDDVED